MGEKEALSHPNYEEESRSVIFLKKEKSKKASNRLGEGRKKGETLRKGRHEKGVIRCRSEKGASKRVRLRHRGLILLRHNKNKQTARLENPEELREENKLDKIKAEIRSLRTKKRKDSKSPKRQSEKESPRP